MEIRNNTSSQNFSGIKYRYHDVVNTWYNYKIKQGGRFAPSKMEKLIEAQKDNPYHVVLNYQGDGKTVKEFATVNGKEFVRGRFESMISMIKRAVNYADALKKKGDEAPLELSGLKDFRLGV